VNFKAEADVAFSGGEDTEINGVRQSLEKIILEFSVVLVGGVDGAVDGTGIEAQLNEPQNPSEHSWSS